MVVVVVVLVLAFSVVAKEEVGVVAVAEVVVEAVVLEGVGGGVGEKVEQGGAAVVIAMKGLEGASTLFPSPPTHISNNN